MLLKIQHAINKQQLEHTPTVDIKAIAKRKMADKLADFINKRLEVTEEDFAGTTDLIMTGKIHILPESQYQHIIGMLTTLRGLDPTINYTINTIIQELGRSEEW